MLFSLRQRFMLRGALPAVSGFILGSLPFWIWNLKNDFASVAFLRTGREGNYVEGVALFLRGLMEAWAPERGFVTLGVAMALWALLLVLSIQGERRMRGEEQRCAPIYRWAAWLLLLAAVLLFADKPSRIGPGRYFLPLLPAMAVLIGCAIATLNRLTKQIAGSMLVVGLLLVQWTFIPVMRDWHEAQKASFAEWNEIGECLEQSGVRELYARYADRTHGYGLNFYFDEAFCLADLPESERQPAYAVKLELSDHPGVLNDFHHLHDFLEQTGGAARDRVCVPEFVLTHDFQSPDPLGMPLRTGFRITEELSGRGITEELRGDRTGPFWLSSQKAGGKVWRVHFDEPTRLTTMRLFLGERHVPSVMKLEGIRAGERDWTTLNGFIVFTPWFWSGGRPYPGGAFYRQDVALDGGALSDLRVVFDEDEPERYALVEGVRFFAADGSTPQRSEPAFKQVVDYLEAEGIRRVYADRWEANQCYLLGPSDMRVTVDERMFRDDPRYLAPLIEPGAEASAVVACSRDAEAMREVLQRAFCAFEETTVSGWTIYLLSPAAQEKEWSSSLIFRGCALQIDDGNQAQAIKPVWLEESLSGMENAGHAAVSFANGVEWVGSHIKTNEMDAGGLFESVWFWNLPDEVDPLDWAVFIHVKDAQGRTCFQVDRLLCGERAQIIRLEQNRWAERVWLKIPDDAAPGEYTVFFGLYEVNPPHQRSRIKGLFEKRSTIQAPFILRVSPIGKSGKKG